MAACCFGASGSAFAADPALAALRDHVDLLSVSPALVAQEDQQRLAEAVYDEHGGIRADAVAAVPR